MDRTKLKLIWKSTLSRYNIQRLFIATLDSVFRHGCETWTMTKKITNNLRMLHKMFRVAFGVHWQQHLTIRELCKVTEKIRRGRLRFAGHC